MTRLLIEPGQRLLFIGDSITACGRRSWHRPLGNGYVADVRLLFAGVIQPPGVSIINRGVSGNCIGDLARRWQQDVIQERPDWLFVLIGINDAWHALGRNAHRTKAERAFQRTASDLLHQASGVVNRSQIVLLEPFLAEPNMTDPFCSALSGYQACLRKVASAGNYRWVGCQQQLDRAMEQYPAQHWAMDRVHPTPAGHQLLANLVVRACHD